MIPKRKVKSLHLPLHKVLPFYGWNCLLAVGIHSFLKAQRSYGTYTNPYICLIINQGHRLGQDFLRFYELVIYLRKKLCSFVETLCSLAKFQRMAVRVPGSGLDPGLPL